MKKTKYICCFRFASHWKNQNRSFRTLTKAFGLRFIISVSGHAGKFDLIQLTLNIGSLIGILGLATFICDIVALYVHRQSDVYRQQKFQDIDLNLLQLETLNTLPLSMMSEESKRKHANHVEQAILTGHVIGNCDVLPNIENLHKDKLNYHDLYDDVSGTSKETNQQSTPMLIYGNYHQQKLGLENSLNDSPSPSYVKHRRSITSRPSQLPFFSNDKTNIVFVDEDSPEINDNNNEVKKTNNEDCNLNSSSIHRHSKQISPKVETFL